MGGGVLDELLRRNDRFCIRILVRPSKKNIKWYKNYKKYTNLSVIWGDLMDYDTVLKAVTGSDYVLHMGGMVSPAADLHPEKTMKVNVTSTQYIVDAIKAQPNKDEIGLLFVGSIAELGNHLPPYHWGRVGDPICTSEFDYYSVSKCISEMIVSESGLKKWASIRQSAMLYPKLLTKANNPTTFHVPLKGVLEWTTIEDSANVMANACAAPHPHPWTQRTPPAQLTRTCR